MRNAFNPAELRSILDGDVGFEWVLGLDRAESKRRRALTHSADSDLDLAIACNLVGYDSASRRLAQQAEDSLLAAVEMDERTNTMPLEYARALRHFNLAQCAWLLRNERDAKALERFVFHKSNYFSDQHSLDKVGVSLGIVDFLDAGAYSPALDLLRRTKIEAPAALDRIRSEGEMAAAVCLSRLGKYPDGEAIERKLTGFLKRKVNEWLINGHYTRAALWMKVVHHTQIGTLLAADIVRKCYDYLPGVTPPTDIQ